MLSSADKKVKSGENMKQKFLDEFVEKLDFYDETYVNNHQSETWWLLAGVVA